MKCPKCKICLAVRKALPKDEVPDSMIDAFHEARGGCMKKLPEKYRKFVLDMIIEMD